MGAYLGSRWLVPLAFAFPGDVAVWLSGLRHLRSRWGVVDGGGGGIGEVAGRDYPALAWPKRGHSPGGSTAAMVVGMVVEGKRWQWEEGVMWWCLNHTCQIWQAAGRGPQTSK